MLDLSGVGGLTPPSPSGASHFLPQVYIAPTGLVKNSKKYIADPLWFDHKSSTGWMMFQGIC